MVAAGLFLVLITAVLFTFELGRRNQGKQGEREAAVRACLLTVEHLRKALATGLVESVTADELVYRQARVGANGLPELGATGEVMWLAPNRVWLDGGTVWRDYEGQSRALARLGDGGTLRFAQVRPDLLEVSVSSSLGTGYSVTTRLRLLNQF